MIEYKTGFSSIDWSMLVDLYGEIGLVAGHGQRKDIDSIRKAFQASAKVVTAWHNQQLVGAGRMLTDGVCYASVFDVGVLPTFQKRGVGKGLMIELMKGNEHLCVHLTSTFGNEEFYGKLGFRRHKTAMAKYPHDSQYLE
jgi:predicted N-acetyltransferase YhbS